jgi:hypothetical protein
LRLDQGRAATIDRVRIDPMMGGKLIGHPLQAAGGLREIIRIWFRDREQRLL